MLILECQEQRIDNFLIPSFSLSTGEISIVQLPGGSLFQPSKNALIDRITNKNTNDTIKKVVPLKYVELLKENRLRERIFPLTVERYFKKHANTQNGIYQKIYDQPGIGPKALIRSLDNGLQRMVALYSTISWTAHIIFDLAGIDPVSGQSIYATVKAIVQSGGAALLIDHCDEFKNHCDHFVKFEQVGTAFRS